MIFPIGDDQVKGGSYPAVSYAFIIFNVLAFIFQLSNDGFTYGYSVIPYEILNGTDLIETTEGVPQAIGPFPIYLTLLFSMFMHGGWMHLIGNMLFLWVFADNIESTVGSIRFVIFYLLAGIIGSLAHVVTNAGSVVPSLGASGAIAGVMGAYLVMFPSSRIKMLVLIIFRTFKIPAFVFLGFWILQQIVSTYGAAVTEDAGGVAWWAHIGGFVFGVVAGLYFRNYVPMIDHVEEEYRSVKVPARRYNNREITRRFRNL